MTIKQMNDRRKELGYSYERVAELSGVPVGTVQKVLGGITKTPRYDTLKALERVLKSYEDWDDDVDWSTATGVCEPMATYGAVKPRKYTISEFYELPLEERCELIDGVIYKLVAPSPIHQMLCTQITLELSLYVRKKKGNCLVFGVGPNTEIDGPEEKGGNTVVLPDVTVLCDRDKLARMSIEGAPDLVVEVLSPSTQKKDKTLKLQKYLNAGVREYWIVDPKKKNIVVYAQDGADDYDVFLYTFENEVPVRIFNEECKIDFKEIYDYIAFMYEK